MTYYYNKIQIDDLFDVVNADVGNKIDKINNNTSNKLILQN